MAHMTLFPGNCEIVEIEEELNPGEHYRSKNYVKPEMRKEEKDHRSLASSAVNTSSLEDDLDQLFEMFNCRTSHGSSRPSKAGSSHKNASKKHVKSGGSSSPGHGIFECVNLKQALRGLCLSQASEMAAMKRLSKSGSSEAGRISTMYHNVVVEASVSNHSQDGGRGGMLEISLVPKDTSFETSRNIHGKSQAPDLWPSNRSSLADRGAVFSPISNERGFALKNSGKQVLKPDPPASAFSPSSPRVDDGVSDMGHSKMTHKGIISPSTELNNQASHTNKLQQKQMSLLASSSPTSKRSMQEVPNGNMAENGEYSASAYLAGQMPSTEALEKDKHASPKIASSPGCGENSRELAWKMPAHKEMFEASTSVGNQLSNFDMGHKEDIVSSSRHFDLIDKAQEFKSYMSESAKHSASTKLVNQTPLTESLHHSNSPLLSSSSPSDGNTSLEYSMKIGYHVFI